MFYKKYILSSDWQKLTISVIDGIITLYSTLLRFVLRLSRSLPKQLAANLGSLPPHFGDVRGSINDGDYLRTTALFVKHDHIGDGWGVPPWTTPQWKMFKDHYPEQVWSQISAMPKAGRWRAIVEKSPHQLKNCCNKWFTLNGLSTLWLTMVNEMVNQGKWSATLVNHEQSWLRVYL